SVWCILVITTLRHVAEVLLSWLRPPKTGTPEGGRKLMKTQMIKWMLGAAAAASVSMSASAANLFLDFNGVGPAVAVTYSLNGNSANTSAGVFNWTVLAGSTQPGFSVGQQVKTFCIELTQNVSDPTNFNVQSLASTPNTGA